MNQGSSKGSYWIASFSSKNRMQEIAISLSNATCFAKFGLCVVVCSDVKIFRIMPNGQSISVNCTHKLIHK